MERKEITQQMKELLNTKLPSEAIKKHPTKSYLSTINAIYVSERLNDVFGVGQWTTKVEFVNEKPSNKTTMVVVKLTLEIPAYGIHYECYGGNDNADYGDAFKGATTDALTKIGSWLGIGAHVWKNDPEGNDTARQTQQTQPKSQPAQPQITQQQACKMAWDYLESNDKALTYYMQQQNVGDIAELDLIQVFNNLKKNNKI